MFFIKIRTQNMYINLINSYSLGIKYYFVITQAYFIHAIKTA